MGLTQISEKKKRPKFRILSIFLSAGPYYTIKGSSNCIPRPSSLSSIAFNRCPPLFTYSLSTENLTGTPYIMRRTFNRFSGITKRNTQKYIIENRFYASFSRNAAIRPLSTLSLAVVRRTYGTTNGVSHESLLSSCPPHNTSIEHGKSDIILITTLLRSRMNNSFSRVSYTPHMVACGGKRADIYKTSAV